MGFIFYCISYEHLISLILLLYCPQQSLPLFCVKDHSTKISEESVGSTRTKCFAQRPMCLQTNDDGPIVERFVC